jgi:DtxR family transcriptional regulator, Mn-dependent transcriptional regulator
MVGKPMSEKISTTIEDYLITIYVLERDGEPVSGARLAEQLGVTPPTVTNTLKRMVRDGLVTMDPAHQPHLTASGLEAASSVVRKHMLAEWMLHRMLAWSKLHKEAHELEHAISNEVEAALLAELDNPELCPHGNPFPGHEDVVSGWVPLTQAASGTRGTIRRIHEFAENNADILAFLEENHLAPGQPVTVGETLAFNETVTIQVDDRLVNLRLGIARYIYIEIEI